MLAKHHKKNLQTLVRAARDGCLCVVEAKRVADGKVVAMLATMSGLDADGEITITPFAEMVDGNPYELYAAPLLEGGFAPS